MQLSQLRYFVAICKYGKITDAATHLHVTQPTISTSLKDLEEELGVILFYRVRKKISLTPEGEFFFKEVTILLQNLDDLNSYMKHLGTQNPAVKLGVPPMIASFLFPDIYKSFHSTYPNIELDIYEYGTLTLKEMLSSDKLDLIIVTNPSNNNTLNSLTISKSQYAFFVGSEHPLARYKQISFNDLVDQPLVLFNNSFYLHQLIMQNFKNISTEHPNIVLKTSQVETIKRFISNNIAGGFINRDCITPSDKLIEIPLDIPLEINICLEWRIGKHLNTSLSTFIDFIAQYYNDNESIKSV